MIKIAYEVNAKVDETFKRKKKCKKRKKILPPHITTTLNKQK